MNLLSLSDNNNNNNNNVVAEVACSKIPANNNKCKCCNKKFGFLGFKCKCGYTFCGAHRYPEEHNCEFDHKFAGKEALAKANPLVIADKLQKI
ncbi:Zinc finger A20 and AN1 domain-containing stress-associated protein 9 [Bienertia sinuspersici]